jgi:hypothetical protein
MEKILEGSLNHFEVPDLLTFLNLGRRTGVLVLERADRESKRPMSSAFSRFCRAATIRSRISRS